MASISAVDAMEKGQCITGAPTEPPEPPTISPSVKSLSGLSWNSQALLLRRSFTQSSKTVQSLWRRIANQWGPSSSKRTGLREPIVRSVHVGPNGYPKLATFLDSDDNFMVYRRFGFLQTRLLLEKQDTLRVLEERLDNLDKSETEGDDNEDNLCTRDGGEASTERINLMTAIGATFREYAALVQAAQAMVASNKPSSSEYASVETFMNNDKPLVEEEGSFIYRKEDLITLRPGREHAWLDTGVEKVLRVLNCSVIQWIFCSAETKKKSNGPEVYYTRERIERLVIVIITLMILTLLIIPVYLLYHLTDNVETSRSNAMCIGILLVFTLLFSACISLFTRAKRHEILAAAATYCAVLVVFLGNISNNGPGGFLGNKGS